MKNFEMEFKYTETYNELVYVKIDGKTYLKEDLHEDIVAVLTALSYIDEKEHYMTETFESMTAMIGYDTVVIGLNKLHELGHDFIPHRHLRKMIMDMYKNKYKGMMR